MYCDYQPLAFAAGLSPIREARPERIAQIRFTGAGGRHRVYRLAVAAQQTQVAEQMLPIFSSHPNRCFAVARSKGPVRKIPDVSEQIAPLRRKKVDQIQPLRLALQHRRRGPRRS